MTKGHHVCNFLSKVLEKKMGVKGRGREKREKMTKQMW